jgi:hypothetical protein
MKDVLAFSEEENGPLDVKPVSKGCALSYAPMWIEAVLARKK